MARLIQAQNKLSKETQNNPTIENQHGKPASGNAVTGCGAWTTCATNEDLPLQQTNTEDTRNHQTPPAAPWNSSCGPALTRRSREIE